MNVNRKPVAMMMLILLMLSFVAPGELVRARSQSEKLAVTLIIDTSGSMKNTDPDGMRETASRIFIDLLSPEDSLGLITFSDEAVEVQSMTVIGTQKGAMKEGLSGRLVHDGNTDYQKAFQKAMEQLDQVTEKGVRKVVVFITDGNPDPDPSRNKEPAFFSGYMDGLWETLRNMGEKEVPVYTLGIGALDMQVLDRIALETKGKSQRFSDATEIARELFHVVALLKNREVFIGEDLNVQNEEEITFDVEKQTLQTTFVVLHDREVMSVSLESPDGKHYDGQVHQVDSDKYSLLTLNELPEGANGEWKLKIKGEGDLEVFGARDSRVKVWLDNPVPGYGYPLGDPLKISASISGEIPEKVTMIGVVSYQGKELESVELERTGERFSGDFVETHAPGEYLLTVQAMENGKEISRATSTFLLKNLPVMKPDFSSESLILGTGQEKIVTSTLEMGANALIQSKDLDLEYFNLIGEINGEKLIFPMLDDGNLALGDLKAGDGRFATRISFDEPGQMELLLQARGLYQGELFIIEKPLGEAAVHAAGGVTVQLKNQIFSALKGEEITLDLELKSTSQFDEMIHLSIPEELGVLFPPDILLKALETKVVGVRFLPNKDMEFDKFALNLEVELENKGTELDVINGELSITTQSKLAGLITLMRKHQVQILSVLMIVLVCILSYLWIGMLLYHLLRRQRDCLNGKLNITHEESGLTQEIDLDAIKKSCIGIILGGTEDENGKVDGIRLESRYRYGLYIEKQGGEGGSRIRAGYRWLFMKGDSVQSIRTSEPGIMLAHEQIYLEMKLDREMTFKSGDYFFQYEYNGHKKMRQSREGRNLLEGRL